MELNEKEKIYNFLRDIINLTKENDDEDKLLIALNEQVRIVNIEARGDFEEALLKIVQEEVCKKTRKILYEVLVSLDAIWNEHTPKKRLTEKFWTAYRKEEFEESVQLYSDLMEQGLDFIDVHELGNVKLLPIDAVGQQKILSYTDRQMQFFDLEMQLLNTISLDEGVRIIDCLPPLKFSNKYGNNVNNKCWILLEKDKCERFIISINPEKNTFDTTTSIPIPGKLNDADRLFRFQSHFLLISNDKIFFYNKCDDKKYEWREWFKEEIKKTKILKGIICFELAANNLWVGIDDGNIRILEELKYLGLRTKFEPLTNTIQSIVASEKYVIITSKDKIVLTDIVGTRQFERIINGRGIKSIILNDEFILTLTSNGMLTGRGIRDGNVSWQINLTDIYESLFICGQKIFCTNKTGKVMIMTVPDQKTLYLALHIKGIEVLQRPNIRKPEAPVRHLSEFVGRLDLLNTIKKNRNFYFLITGNPRIGKTSVLNILNELLASDSVCCYIDMESLERDSNSYEEFEEKFIIRCLAQHASSLIDIDFRTEYQRLEASIKKVRGPKRYCVFCIDNFFLPSFKTVEENNKFDSFIINLLSHSQTRLILTCRKKNFKCMQRKLAQIERIKGVRKKAYCYTLPLFTESEIKMAIRDMISSRYNELEKIYQCIGNFPHLFPFLKNCNSFMEDSVEEICNSYAVNIFEYFYDLSKEAQLLIGVFFHEMLISKIILFDNLYHKYPLLAEIMPKSSLISTLNEINISYDCFKITINEDKNEFEIQLQNQVKLFNKASQRLPGIILFIAMNQLMTNSTPKNAEVFVLAYREALRIRANANENYEKSQDNYYNDLRKKYENEFYIWRVSEEGRQTLCIPRTTFIIIRLIPWIKDESGKNFNDLYNSIHVYLNKSATLVTEGKSTQKFYVLLFNFCDTSRDDIKKELAGLERVSVIDTKIMNDILLCKDLLFRTTEVIFQQLNISERSPYTTTGGVQELFYGREMEITLIRGLPENIGIFGTRTIGKTSLLLKLYREIQGQADWKVYALDCAGIEDEQTLLDELAIKMKVERSDDISTIEKFKNYITKKAEEEECQFLFLLDEVDGLVAYDVANDEKIFSTFNKLCNEPLVKGGVAARFVLFGFQQMYEQMHNPKSRLYNFMVFFPLKSLDAGSAFKLVTTPMQNIHVKWDNEKDALYLVERCSSYPLLLQAACHTLLTILDRKAKNTDVIEKEDVIRVFAQERFIGLCMRFYDPFIKKSLRPKRIFRKQKKGIAWEEECFFEEIHKITILALTIFQHEKKKSIFAPTDIQDELKKLKIDISPEHVQEIIKRLRLSGTLKLIEEPIMIAKNEDKLKGEMVEKIIKKESKAEKIPGEFNITTPTFYDKSKAFILVHRYEFGIKIFPEILVAHFHGIEKCKEQLQALVKRKSWKKWARRLERNG